MHKISLVTSFQLVLLHKVKKVKSIICAHCAAKRDWLRENGVMRLPDTWSETKARRDDEMTVAHIFINEAGTAIQSALHRLCGEEVSHVKRKGLLEKKASPKTQGLARISK
jgi:hypothetical protein